MMDDNGSEYRHATFGEEMEGRKIISTWIARDDENERIHFVTDDGHFVMTHIQDCCESVEIKEIDNDLNKLVGATIVEASVESNEGDVPNDYGTFTWTFYKLATNRGDYFTISWYGESNGYYSEDADFIELNQATSTNEIAKAKGE